MKARTSPIGCALAAAVLGLLPAGAQTPAPGLHTQGSTAGPIVESPEAMRVTTVIQCFCGTCVNQTLHDCTCGLAATERGKVAGALAAGETPESLIARYVAEHGPQVRIVPERRGLDLIGWSVPFAAALAGLLALGLVLAQWRRRGAMRAAACDGAASPADRRYLDRLERDLKELD